MKKFLFLFSVILYTLYSILYTHAPQVHAASVKPFPPFSEEGNPVEDYYFSEIFPLFRYILPRNLQIYENMDRSRKYERYEICSNGDDRDYDCSNDDTACDGGNVKVCYLHGGYAYTASSSPNDSCTSKIVDAKHPPGTEGTCSYDQKPKVAKEIKGTDFSTGDLTYPKLQSNSGMYTNIGNPDNPITYGSSYLDSNACEITTRKMLVLRRAKHTQATLRQTGEWPLGWVDWNYKDTKAGMTKSLIEINDELPDDIAVNLNALVEGTDDYFLTGGNLAVVSDISKPKQKICDAVSRYQSMTPPPDWLKDLATSPMYSPSFRQGYARPSICVWWFCCPTTVCPVEPKGTKRGLYFNTSISQAYGAAIDEMFARHSTEEGAKIFKILVTKNPLVRYLTSAEPEATPSKIREKLDIMQKGTCVDYVPWGNWLGFGTHLDYLDSNNFLGPNNTCPDYTLMPELTKETAKAFTPSPLSALVNLIWGQQEDEVKTVKYHYLTIPDAMAQSMRDIQQPVYDTGDTLAELNAIQDYNNSLSNSVEEDKDNLYGEDSGPQNPKRALGLMACNDPMYSAQKLTSIEEYALGVHHGCFDEDTVPVGKCDGKLFAKLIAGSSYTESSPKGTEYFNSNIKTRLTPELMNTYAAAEKETGVPCEILAGIHFVEADNNPEGSLVSGRTLGTPEPDAGGKIFHTLLETASYAGEHLKGKVGGNIGDAATAITALSRYNGGGNSNCQSGYPYPIPYGGCPRAFEGEDDPYPTSFLDTKHDSMYLLYCADYTACAPAIFERPGSFTVALNVYNSITKDGYSNSDLPPVQPSTSPNPSTTPNIGGGGSSGFFPKSCGSESLSTALGCIPYTRDAFISALLTFIVGIAGAIALVVMLIATIQIMTAGGDAKKLQAGRDLFTSAIIGLLFLIFSTSLLRLVAGDIIKLPGF